MLLLGKKDISQSGPLCFIQNDNMQVSTRGHLQERVGDYHKYFGQVGKRLQSTWKENKTLPKTKVILGKTNSTLFLFSFFCEAIKKRDHLEYFLPLKGFRIQRKIYVLWSKASTGNIYRRGTSASDNTSSLI